MGRRAKPLPPLAELQRLFTYNPETGELLRADGKKAGTVKAGAKPYLRTMICGRQYLVHRICWKLLTGKEPSDVLDHVNGDGLDNRAANLQESDAFLNGNNLQRDGVRGVTWYRRTSKWLVHIRDGKTQHHIGYFDNHLDAVAARKSAEQRLGYL